jgi:hypothetical protein
MVCDKLGRRRIIFRNPYRMGQDVYHANYATDRLSHFQSDICGLSTLYAATLCLSSVTYADSLQVGIAITRSELSASLQM